MALGAAESISPITGDVNDASFGEASKDHSESHHVLWRLLDEDSSAGLGGEARDLAIHEVDSPRGLVGRFPEGISLEPEVETFFSEEVLPIEETRFAFDAETIPMGLKQGLQEGRSAPRCAHHEDHRVIRRE